MAETITNTIQTQTAIKDAADPAFKPEKTPETYFFGAIRQGQNVNSEGGAELTDQEINNAITSYVRAGGTLELSKEAVKTSVKLMQKYADVLSQASTDTQVVAKSAADKNIDKQAELLTQLIAATKLATDTQMRIDATPYQAKAGMVGMFASFGFLIKGVADIMGNSKWSDIGQQMMDIAKAGEAELQFKPDVSKLEAGEFQERLNITLDKAQRSISSSVPTAMDHVDPSNLGDQGIAEKYQDALPSNLNVYDSSTKPQGSPKIELPKINGGLDPNAPAPHP